MIGCPIREKQRNKQAQVGRGTIAIAFTHSILLWPGFLKIWKKWGEMACYSVQVAEALKLVALLYFSWLIRIDARTVNNEVPLPVVKSIYTRTGRRTCLMIHNGFNTAMGCTNFQRFFSPLKAVIGASIVAAMYSRVGIYFGQYRYQIINTIVFIHLFIHSFSSSFS